MMENLDRKYKIIYPEKVRKFINANENTQIILNAMESQLNKHFPGNEFSLEICDDLGWTTETKILLNVHVTPEMFFNGILDHFNSIYREIEPVIDEIENTVVLFPEIDGTDIDKMSNTCAANVIARTAYFNNYNNGIIQREMSFRDIPKDQQVSEIIESAKLTKTRIFQILSMTFSSSFLMWTTSSPSWRKTEQN